MSVDIGFVVYCDADDCRRYATFLVSSHAEARVAAELEGWDRTEDGNDLCPGHNSTGGPF